MNDSVFIPIFITILIPIYWLFLRHTAINARGSVAKQVDNYLGDEENPEELKLLVYHMFKECMDDFLPTKIMIYYLLIKNNKDSTHSIRKMKLKFGDEKLNKTTKLIQKMMLVNVVLSPLQVSTYSFVLIFVSVIKSIFSFPSKAFGSTARRTESAWYRAIH